MADAATFAARIASASSARVGPDTRPLRIERGGYLFVNVPASDLAAQAGLEPDVYSLARMIASEWHSGPPLGLIALAEAARNRARMVGQSVTRMLTNTTSGAQDDYPDGVYGEQAGRWASTLQDPNGRHVEAAYIALYDGSELAEGAAKFFDPEVQDGGVQRGRSVRPADEIVQKWTSEGWQFIWPAALRSIDPYKLMLFRKVGDGADASEALAVVQRGRETGSGLGGGDVGGGGTAIADAGDATGGEAQGRDLPPGPDSRRSLLREPLFWLLLAAGLA